MTGWLWERRNVVAWVLVGCVNVVVASMLVQNDQDITDTASTAAQTARQTREAVAAINRNRAHNARQFAAKDRQLCRVTTTLLNMQVESTRSATALFRPLFASDSVGFERAVQASRERIARLRAVRDSLDCTRRLRLR